MEDFPTARARKKRRCAKRNVADGGRVSDGKVTNQKSLPRDPLLKWCIRQMRSDKVQCAMKIQKWWRILAGGMPFKYKKTR